MEGLTIVKELQTPHGSARMTGTTLVQVNTGAMPGEIDAGDVLRVNFDQRTIRDDGWYLVRVGKWSGVRRFEDTIGGLRVLDCGVWRAAPAGLLIEGYVEDVYRSSKNLRALH